MAGTFSGPGHRVVSGERPVVGLTVFTNEYKEGTITKVSDEGKCGYYCEAWHEVTYPATAESPERKITMNCDRLTTRDPR